MNSDREQELQRLVEQTRAQLIDFGIKPSSYEVGYGYLLGTLHHILDVIAQAGDPDSTIGTVSAALARKRRAEAG